MKKSLVALAALAVVGAASAQSSVTLYGYGDLGFGQSVVNSGASQDFRFNPSLSDVGGIRIGLKGSEDLGGGMKANFQMESNAYNGDTGSGSGFNRANWFSLSGGFGEVRLGRQARNAVVAAVMSSPAGWRGSDPEFATGTRYSIENSTANGNSSRISSMINYISPTMSGFTARVGFVPKANADSNNGAASNGAVTDIALLYANGPLAVNVGYMKADNGDANQGVHVKYDFGTFALMGSYNDRGAVQAASSSFGAAAPAQKGYSLGATVPFGATVLYVDFAKNNDASVHTSAYEVGVDYNLSKRTALSAFVAGGDGYDAGYFLGVRHSF
jgi:predicted porin